MNFFKISVQSTQGTELQEKEEDKNYKYKDKLIRKIVRIKGIY